MLRSNVKKQKILKNFKYYNHDDMKIFIVGHIVSNMKKKTVFNRIFGTSVLTELFITYKDLSKIASHSVTY